MGPLLGTRLDIILSLKKKKKRLDIIRFRIFNMPVRIQIKYTFLKEKSDNVVSTFVEKNILIKRFFFLG